MLMLTLHIITTSLLHTQAKFNVASCVEATSLACLSLHDCVHEALLHTAVLWDVLLSCSSDVWSVH